MFFVGLIYASLSLLLVHWFFSADLGQSDALNLKITLVLLIQVKFLRCGHMSFLFLHLLSLMKEEGGSFTYTGPDGKPVDLDIFNTPLPGEVTVPLKKIK